MQVRFSHSAPAPRGIQARRMAAWLVAGALVACVDREPSAPPGDISALAAARRGDVVAVVIAPEGATLHPGDTQQFTTNGVLSTGDTASLRVSYSATGGTIASRGRTDGLYTAGSLAGSYQVVTTDRRSGLADTAPVTIVADSVAPPPPPPPPGATIDVLPTVETDPSHHTGDTADDIAFWIHPSDGALSLLIGDDKDGGLMVWGLDGKEVQYVDGTDYNNLDLRYNFPLAGQFSDGTPHQSVALLFVGDETGVAMDFFKVNPVTRRLEPAGTLPTARGLVPYGGCMYHSAATGKYYVFITSDPGIVQQFEVRDDGGQVGGTLVREFSVSSVTEGCVADDVMGQLYIAQEDVGIWKFGAEPGAGSTRTQVDVTGQGGNLKADVEGLAIYYADANTGYLLASSQGNSTFVIYARDGANPLLGKFTVGANGTIDGVTGTDGVDVANWGMGAGFPMGVVAVHDNSNSGALASNIKLVPWEAIARGLGLKIAPSYDVRR